MGFTPSRKNRNLCAKCCDTLPRGGLEVDIAVLFADVRRSTALGEQLAPAAFAAVLNRFYHAATETLIRHGRNRLVYRTLTGLGTFPGPVFLTEPHGISDCRT
jgi:class 3 adenylate cyclase